MVNPSSRRGRGGGGAETEARQATKARREPEKRHVRRGKEKVGGEVTNDSRGKGEDKNAGMGSGSRTQCLLSISIPQVNFLQTPPTKGNRLLFWFSIISSSTVFNQKMQGCDEK